jgi:hypothetical protein
MFTRTGTRILAGGVAGLLAAPAQAQLQQGPEWRVNTYLTGRQGQPAVAADPNGHFWSAWSGAGPGDADGVFVRPHLSSGVPVGTEFRVNTYTAYPAAFPALAATGSNGFVLVWESLGRDGDRLGVFGRRYDPFGSGLGTEFQVNSYTTGYQFDADVASGPDGTFVVTWMDAQGVYPSLSFTVMGQRYAPSGAAQGSNFRLGSYVAPGQFNADVVFDRNGNAIAVWNGRGPGDSGGIFARRFDATGAAVGAEFLVNTYTTAAQSRPSIDVAADGRYAVVWDSYQPPAAYEVRGQRFTAPDVPLGVEFAVNTYTESFDFAPKVAMDADGSFVAAWTALHPGFSDVSAQEYDATGNRVGGEFQVNSTPGYAYVYGGTAVPLSPQEFIVVWELSGAGNAVDVYAKRLGDVLFGDGFNRAPPP